MNLLKRLTHSIGVACLFAVPLASYGVTTPHSIKTNNISNRLVELRKVAIKDLTGVSALHFAYTLEGYMTEPNFKLFFDWVMLSASRGNDDALYQAGLHYEYGIGLASNIDLAIQYYSHIQRSKPDLSRILYRAETRSLCEKPELSKSIKASLDSRPTILFGSNFTCLNRESLEGILLSGGAKKLSSNELTDTYDGSVQLHYSKRIYTDYSASGDLLNIRFYISQVDVNDVLYEMRELFGKEEPNYGAEPIRGKEWVWHRNDGIDITLIKDGEYSMLTMADISSSFVERRQAVYPFEAGNQLVTK